MIFRQLQRGAGVTVHPITAHLKSSRRKRGADAKAAAVCAFRSGAQSGSTPSSRAFCCMGLLASASSTASSCATSVLATAITCCARQGLGLHMKMAVLVAGYSVILRH